MLVMAEGGLLWPVGSGLPSTFSSQLNRAPPEALHFRWTLQSLAIASLLHRQKPPTTKRKAGSRRLSSPKQTIVLGNGEAAMPQNLSPTPLLTRVLIMRSLAVALLFGGPLAVFKALISALPPDFSQRWRTFFEEQSRKEPSASCRRGKKRIVIYDRHGDVIATVGSASQVCLSDSGSPTRINSTIPAFLWQAVVACEDRRFFQHRGVDPRGIARAAFSLSSNGGGSTISQQVAKNLFLSSERTWMRKVMEMFLALILEFRMCKWDILQTYLKKIYWGHGNYGVDAASDFYFGKHVSLLNIGECAMLAGMIPAPEIFSPFHDASRGKRAQGRALRRMVEVGFLDSHNAEAILNEPLELTMGGGITNQSSCKAPYFVDEVLKHLNEKYGCSSVLEGGLKVYTTLDLRMQEIAEKAVNERAAQIDSQQIGLTELAIKQMQKKLNDLDTTRNFIIKKVTSKILSKQDVNDNDDRQLVEQAVAKIDNKFSSRKQSLQVSIEKLQRELKVAVGARVEATLTAIDHSDGGVRVLIGGRDYIDSNFNWSTQANRPPGSAFKPVIYLTALTENINIKEILRDDACTLGADFPHKGKAAYGKIGEPFSGHFDEPCAALCSNFGADKVLRMAKGLGIEDPLPMNSKLASEGLKIKPIQLATVYSTIAAGGVRHRPFYVTRVETADGEILEETKISEAVRVVEEHVTTRLKKALQVQRERGQMTRIKRLCMGHSIMSGGHRDAWCAGFMRDLTCVVWLGYDDASCAGLNLHSDSRAAQAAAEIWKCFMTSSSTDQSIKKLKRGHLSAVKIPRSLLKVHGSPKKLHPRSSREDSATHGRLVWKNVWDWEEASSVWDERESMAEWTEKHLDRAAKVNALKHIWS